MPLRITIDPNARSFSFDLVKTINQLYFLHLLATDPSKVVPPGKSLVSMMSLVDIEPQDHGAKQGDVDAELHAKVKEVVHAAFWKEALESLSSPLPSVQLPRLKGLYNDILESLSPILPPNHRIVQSLSLPPPPTSSPLHSTLALLKDIILLLRQRCAPVRDSSLDHLLSTLEDSPSLKPLQTQELSYDSALAGSSGPHESKHTRTHAISPLAKLVVDTIRAVMTLADEMKADLNAFVLGSMTEPQLRSLILQQARSKERELVLRVWGNDAKDGSDFIRQRWKIWMAAPDFLAYHQQMIPQDKRWKLRLVHALHSELPVSCNLPNEVLHQPGGDIASPTNEVPPHFFFSTPEISYLQDFLQAIVVAASLRVLIGMIPLAVEDGSNSAPKHDFVERIWSLLLSIVDADDRQPSSQIAETKVENLADEVIRARRLLSPSGSLDGDEETKLRLTVDRTLRPDDHVFRLLRSRLRTAIQNGLFSATDGVEGSSISRSEDNIPQTLRTGRDHPGERIGKRPRLIIDNESLPSRPKMKPSLLLIKGFEDPLLAKLVQEAYAKITDCVTWVEQVWGDLIDQNIS